MDQTKVVAAVKSEIATTAPPSNRTSSRHVAQHGTSDGNIEELHKPGDSGNARKGSGS